MVRMTCFPTCLLHTHIFLQVAHLHVGMQVPTCACRDVHALLAVAQAPRMMAPGCNHFGGTGEAAAAALANLTLLGDFQSPLSRLSQLLSVKPIAAAITKSPRWSPARSSELAGRSVEVGCSSCMSLC